MTEVYRRFYEGRVSLDNDVSWFLVFSLASNFLQALSTRLYLNMNLERLGFKLPSYSLLSQMVQLFIFYSLSRRM
jgi:hypothetical protein